MAADERHQQLEAWIIEVLGQPLACEAASSDASFRRYFRYQFLDRSVIAMDAPPASEDCKPFVAIDRMLAEAGVCVPDLIAEDIDNGFLLLSDLGADTYLDVMSRPNFDPDTADSLFHDAITALIRMQRIDNIDSLPSYDEALLFKELTLFTDWYLVKHLGLALDVQWQDLLQKLFEQIITLTLKQAKVFVHRDYMPRNLMVSTPNPGVLDFQDAVSGPISYDPICLFKDAFISWPEEKVQQWLQQYWREAKNTGLPVPEDVDSFLLDCDIMGVHRHLKVIGIFARICHRDGKPKYLQDAPRFFDYLNKVAARRPELDLLKQVLIRLEQVTA